MTTTPSGVMVVPAPRFADVLAADLEGRILPALVIESGVEVDLDALDVLDDLDDLDERDQRDQRDQAVEPRAARRVGADEPERLRATVLPLIAAVSAAARPDADGQHVAAQLLVAVVGDFARAALASSGELIASVPELRQLAALLDEIDAVTSNGVRAHVAGGRAT